MPEYKLIQGDQEEVEPQINRLAKDGWRPISVTACGPNNWELCVLLEKK
jgi:hypothetical protein